MASERSLAWPERARLSIVIPAFDEAQRLPPTLRRIGRYLADHERWLPAQIVVVDDGSTDGTADAVREISLPPGLRLEAVSHARNRGKGAAVRTGFARSTGDQVLLTDADLAAPVDELERLAAAAGPGLVVIGSRALDRTLISNRQPLYRDLMGRLFNLAVRATALPGVADSQCGFKLFPGELARSLAAVQRISGFAYDVELLLLARRWGWEVREVAVRWGHVEASRVRAVRHSVAMLVELLGLAARRVAGRLPTAPPALGAPPDARE